MEIVKTPNRIQRKRTKGWRMPPNTVYVGRGTIWGNPFKIEQGIMTRDESLEHYKTYAEGFTRLELKPLIGKDLACWCGLDKPCHADILLEIVNKEE